MSYRIISMRGGYGQKSAESKEFYEAMDMAKEGMERICELAEEMMDQYGERRGGYGGRGRGGYGSRGGYGNREDWEEMDEMYGERRRRDSRGRYM